MRSKKEREPVRHENFSPKIISLKPKKSKRNSTAEDLQEVASSNLKSISERNQISEDQAEQNQIN